MKTLLFVLLTLAIGCGGAPFIADTTPEEHPDATPGHDAAPDVAPGHDAGPSPEAAPEASLEASQDAGPEADDGLEAEASSTCVGDLSGIGANDFHITFTLTIATTEPVSIISQRIDCDYSPSFWDIQMSAAGGIIGITGDGNPNDIVTVEAGDSINDGQPHQVVVARTGGSLWYSSDGTVHSAYVSDAFSFGDMTPVAYGVDGCPVTKTIGVVKNLCITTP